MLKQACAILLIAATARAQTAVQPFYHANLDRNQSNTSQSIVRIGTCGAGPRKRC